MFEKLFLAMMEVSNGSNTAFNLFILKGCLKYPHVEIHTHGFT